MSKAPVFFAGAVLAYIGYRAYRGAGDSGYSILDDLTSTMGTVVAVASTTVDDFPARAIDPKTGADYSDLIASYARRNGVPPLLTWAQLRLESGFNAAALGPVTRYGRPKGIAQFLDSTAAEYGVSQYDPESSISGNTRYMAALYRATGTWRGALAAYNWGLGNFKANGGLGNLPAETRNYLAKIYEPYADRLPK